MIWALVGGFFVGVCFGALIVALCVAGSRG